MRKPNSDQCKQIEENNRMGKTRDLFKKIRDTKAQHSENEDHGIWSHHFMGNRWGNSGNSVRLYFWAPKSLQMVTAAMKLKDAYSLEEKL